MQPLANLLLVVQILFYVVASAATIVLTIKALPALKWLTGKLERDKDNGEHLAHILMASYNLPGA